MPNVICGCGKSVETKPEWAGQWIACPGCGGTLYAPFPGDRPAPPIPVIETMPTPPLPPLPIAAPTRLCPWCAETIPVADAFCTFCKGDTAAQPPKPIALPPPSTGPKTDNAGVAPLVVGVLGFMFCQLLGPIAWAMGSRYEKDCRARGLVPSGAGTAGKILGIVATVILFLVLGFWAFFAIAAIATSK
ncbi:MAG TPA: DUF4190 domain-containing protein [Planctomycetota bacterium]|nr:DUF4190 domain-containing protein [Planctomycetota bacterium]